MQPKPTNPHLPVCEPRDVVLQAAMYRLGNIEEEIQAGYNILRQYHKTVTVFGSARTPENDPYFKKAEEMGRALAKAGYAVVSGGGHGIMEAANRGAFEAKGDSIGFNITLPHEQTLNNYTTESLAFSHFAPRKIVMTLYADAYVYFPGGFGTMDELSEILTLIETGKTNRVPIVLFGSEFWTPLNEFVKTIMLEKFHFISKSDRELYTITDSIDQAINIVRSGQSYCDH